MVMTAKPPSLLTVVGARPQFIKAAAVSRAIAAHGGLAESIVHTGQHFDGNMSDVFFDELSIPKPAYNLSINSGPHGAMTGRMLEALERVMIEAKPEGVLVYGDTNSTLAGALAAAKLAIPVFHVEAGLRSFLHSQPEEINRVLTDRLSALLFCPSRVAVEHLAREGLTRGVLDAGDVMREVAALTSDQVRGDDAVLRRIGIEDGRYMLATLHRQETTDDPVVLARAVAYLRTQAADLPLVMPVHPRTSKAFERHGIDVGWLRLVPPLGYRDMTRVLMGARLVLTDSGGLQKEAYWHRVPCVTLRETTEWEETIAAGWNRLWTAPEFAQPRLDIPAYDRMGASACIASEVASFLAS